MNTQKGSAPILIILLGLVVIGGGVYVYDQKNDLGIFGKKENTEPLLVVEENIIKNDSEKKDNIDTSIISKDKENSNKIETKTGVVGKIDSKITTNNTLVVDPIVSPITDLWGIFDQVTLALKNKDVSSYNKFSYTQVTKEEASQFADFIPYLLDMMSKINKSDYTNKLQDDKQAIFSIKPIETTDNYKIEQIMFIKQDGLWKLLTVSNKEFIGTVTPDSDKDGLTDNEEICTANHDPKCVKTDPSKKDTDGDGWWDGIDESMNPF